MRHWLKSASSSGVSALPQGERQRLARALHQSTAQALAVLTINLDLVQKRATRLDPRARRMLDESRSLASQCFDDILGLVDVLYPPIVDEIGLDVDGQDHRHER